MCVVSAVGDHYGHEWKKFGDPANPTLDWLKRLRDPMSPDPNYWQPHLGNIEPPITKEEHSALVQQVKDMKALLKIAVDYDRRNNEPGCEIEEKIELLRSVASAFGIDIDEILK